MSDQLEPNQFSQSDDNLIAYLKMMDELAAMNGTNLLWWCTPFASKHRFLSPLERLMGSWPKKEKSVWRIVLHFLVWLVGLFQYGGKIFCRAMRSRKLFGKCLNQHGTIYLIKSFAYASSIRGGRYNDPFFKELGDSIGQQLDLGQTVLTVVSDFDESGRTLEEMAKLAGSPVVPIEFFLYINDVIKGIVDLTRERLFSSFQVPDTLKFKDENVAALVRDALKGTPGKIDLQHYLHQVVALRLARRFDILGCAMTYEGNPWEKMFVAGLREGQPDIQVVGYQHSVVPTAAAGVFPGPNELEHAPLPDYILTTGEVTASIIRKYSALQPERVAVAGSLRYSYLRSLSLTKRRQVEMFTVLVVPEGVPEACDLISYAIDQARENPHLQFRMRTHPLMPLSYFLDQLGVSLSSLPNVSESKDLNVAEDITCCDAVLYWGSTVALEASMIGLPLIHFNRNEVLTYDPLFQFFTFKWVVSEGVSLAKVVACIAEMSDADFARRAILGRTYVESYFSPVTKNTLDFFLHPERMLNV